MPNQSLSNSRKMIYFYLIALLVVGALYDQTKSPQGDSVKQILSLINYSLKKIQ